MSGFFCGKCGIAARTEDVFCHRCGSELNIQATPNTEYAASQRKICPQCGEYVPMGDRFCDKCGTGLVTPGFNTQIHTKRRMAPSGVTTHRRRRGFFFKLISALLFWGMAIGAIYAVYRFLGSGIPWSDVAAVVAGTEPRTGEVPLMDTDVHSEELPPIVPETSDSGDLPPIVPETENLGGLPDSPDPIPTEPIQAEPIPPPKPEWGEQDANGYSVLTLPEQDEAGRVDVSLRGVVTGNGVNLRAEPNTNSERLGQFSSGREFDVIRRYRQGNAGYFWYEVSSGGDNGWMYGQYLRVEEE